MKKKQFVCMIAVLLLILAGCGKQNVEESTTAAPETTVEVAAEPTVTEESIPGVEDSIFDDETEPTVEETQPQTEATEPAETTKPTEAPKPSETTPPTEAPQPSETTPPTETPQPETKPQSEYETFQNMSAADQQAHMESFDSMDAFFDWYNNAKAEYEAANPPIDIGNGSIDMGDLMG